MPRLRRPFGRCWPSSPRAFPPPPPPRRRHRLPNVLDNQASWDLDRRALAIESHVSDTARAICLEHQASLW
jgi:hypothetical protein